MIATDFGAWAKPDLELALGGRTYSVRPPSVADMAPVLALATRFEVGSDLTPPGAQATIDAIPDATHPALGSTYDELVEAGVDPETLARMGVYAVWFWARGKEYADTMASLIWDPQSALAGGVDPKALGRAVRRIGLSSGLATQLAKTKTGSRSTRTTGQRRSKRHGRKRK